MTMKKSPQERKVFIANYLQELERSLYPNKVEKATVNILDADFVDSFVSFSGCLSKPTEHGVQTCKQLSRDLTEMWQNGEIMRKLVRLPAGTRSTGAPGWVYFYSL